MYMIDRIVVMISLLPPFSWNKLRPSRPLDYPCGVPLHPVAMRWCVLPRLECYNMTCTRGWSFRIHSHTPFLYEFSSLKSKEHSLGIISGNIWSIKKDLNNCAIKHKLEVPCASFEETCAQTRTFSSTPFSMGGNHFLVHGRETEITSFFIVLNLLS